MITTKLHVNLTSYLLHPEVNTGELALDIERAARSGGAFVAVKTCDAVERSVLFTPSLVVELEPLEIDDVSASRLPAVGEVGTGDWETHSGELATFSGLERYEARNPSYFSW